MSSPCELKGGRSPARKAGGIRIPGSTGYISGAGAHAGRDKEDESCDSDTCHEDKMRTNKSKKYNHFQGLESSKIIYNNNMSAAKENPSAGPGGIGTSLNQPKKNKLV
ncbi:hypothetical protein AX774_g781 [Zancudomyces culisetae]|uniref:Uncharacterized protein n=1 Tax=Zancudomyces culisetae TaxID=1213189 RepID=A0A1R1PXG2_ZANCU|nr:hypothetical protein AX774_g781 [Zancudomyces culisetae]|eukprot:OMH85670.1 hypothetical protein AX774_g781 [Zancudomyces culisetae]